MEVRIVTAPDHLSTQLADAILDLRTRGDGDLYLTESHRYEYVGDCPLKWRLLERFCMCWIGEGCLLILVNPETVSQAQRVVEGARPDARIRVDLPEAESRRSMSSKECL